MNTALIARICHETNRAYCQNLGDVSQPLWEMAPDWQKDSAINGVQFHLDILEGGSEPTPSLSHDSWLREKKAAGWKWGPVKDADKREHPCCLPYEQLPAEQRMKDYLFAAIVKAFYEAEAKTTVVR